MNPLEILRGQLTKLAEQRAALSTEMRAVIESAGTAGRTNLTDDEQKTYDEKRAALVKADADIDAAQARIKDLEDDDKRAATANKILADAGQAGERRSGGAVVKSEPTAYGQGRRHSYFIDLARDQLGRGDGDGGVQAARERLSRHAKELSVEMPAREARRESAAMRALDGIEGRGGKTLSAEERASVFERGLEQRVNPNRTDGQGGYFVPPLWLVDQYIELA
ncbi:MAG: phage-related major capsid protein, partial [Pseudonocardiales bacterium]|nr:phage-related major capsid protein [Pseudonocardiales bacterium]